MKDIFKKLGLSLKHVSILHSFFSNADNFKRDEARDCDNYKKNNRRLKGILSELKLENELYSGRGRQMILSDLLEYVFIGRGYYALRSKQDKELFVKAILYFVNMLMCYEALTVSNGLRKRFLKKLGGSIKEVTTEELFKELSGFNGTIGLPSAISDAAPKLNRYFDTFLPKTAGGLWHELMVYIFLLRNNVGHIIPLLLSQRLMGRDDHIIPPDFLVITKTKNIYGIEVGIKKEIQSGSFSLKTNIPTATIDTINSRVSDRCPICLKWIPFCDFVIDRYSNFDEVIGRDEVRCLNDCDLFSREQIMNGECPNTKYSRSRGKSLKHTHHDYSDGRHYHYQCVLKNVSDKARNLLINSEDAVALKTHHPYYAGLEPLLNEK
jgi:hypothetical protein